MKGDFIPRLCDAFGGDGRRVVNMRLQPDSDGRQTLVPVEAPPVTAGLSGWRPVCGCSGRVLLSAGVSAAVADETQEAPEAIGWSFPGAPQCAVPSGETEAIVMTAKGAVRVGFGSGQPTAEATGHRYPAITMRAVQTSVAPMQIGAHTLSKVYAEGHRLTGADRDALAGEVTDAYLDAVATAAAAGCYVQPVLARYRLKDRRGAVLFESPAVLLSLPEVSQCMAGIELRCDGSATVATEVQLKLWRIELMLPSDNMPGVAAVEVSASPQFHPYNSSERGRAVVARDTEGYKIRVSLPGRSHALGGNNNGQVLSAIARMGSLERPAGHVENPFSGTARCIRLAAAAEADVAADVKALEKSRRTALGRASFAEALLSAPHTFTAACTATDGAITAWGGLRAIRAEPFSPAIFATDTADCAWEARVIVRFDGKRGVEASFSGKSGCPTALGPVVSYPSPDARSMTVLVSGGGTVRRFDCELTPDESGRRAVYTTPDMKPTALPSSDGIAIVDITDAGEDFGDTIAFTPADNPLHITAVTASGAGHAAALAAVAGAEQAWDRGRSRFYAACSGGVVSLAVNGSGGCTARTVDSRGAMGDSCMAAARGEVYVLLKTVSGSVVSVLSARGAVRDICRAAPFSALAYDSTHDELIAYRHGGGATVFCREGTYELSCGDCTGTVHTGGEWYALFATGLCRVSQSGTALFADVEYSDVFTPHGRRAFMPLRLLADMTSRSLSCTLSLSASGRPIAERKISGAVLSPMGIRLTGAPARALTLSLKGRAAAATTVRMFSLETSWIRK